MILLFESKVFDKQYFVELSDNAWQMRNIGGPEDGGPPQDWTTGTSGDRMMLNTDVCLIYDIDENVDSGTNCCTNPDGENPCIDQAASRRRCPRLKEDDYDPDIYSGKKKSTDVSNMEAHEKEDEEEPSSKATGNDKTNHESATAKKVKKRKR